MSDVDGMATPPEPEVRPQSPERPGVYGPIAAGARLTYGWATIPAQLAMYLVSVVPVIIILAIYAAVAAMGGNAPVSPDGELAPDLMLVTLIITVAVQIPVWALLVILWVRGFERRSLASAGFRGPNALSRYGVGVLIGLATAAALAMLSPFVVTAPAEMPEVFDVSRLATLPWLVMMAAVVAVFMLQGACEEIAFRGWMMSTVAARWGLAAGVFTNTLLFGALHLHVFAGGAIAGGAAISAITCVGLFMSLWALWDRSIAGVCGAHGAFNATLVVLGMIGVAALDPAAGPGDVLLQTLNQATGLEGDGQIGGSLLQLGVFGSLSVLVGWRLMRRARSG